MKRFIGLLAVLLLLVACGSNWDGPELGDFPPINKKVIEAPFTLTAPSSRSPAPFTFTSSNPAVGTISGATVTITGVGVSTITASQQRDGAYGPTSKSTTLTVTAGDCDAGYTLVNGTCTANLTCVSPATLSNNQCVAPSSSAKFVTSGSLKWMGVTATQHNYADALSFCTNSMIDNQTGWRLPTAAELNNLFSANAITGQGWTVGNTWSSTAGTQAASHRAINLSTNDTLNRADTDSAYFTCVRTAS
jgi:hypothetical protein